MGARRAGKAERLVPPVVLAVGVAVFTTAWTGYAWQQFLTLTLPAFDFGINYQSVWAAAHGSSLDFFNVGIGSLILYAFVPVYWALPSTSSLFLFLAGFQAAWLAIGCVPLYLVAKDRLGRAWYALALAVAYLIFPALVGTVWFPFHYEALFPTFFLFGYWRYRKEDWRSAGAFWAVACFTHVAATVVLGAFALGILAEPRLASWVQRRRAGRTSNQQGPGGPAGPGPTEPAAKRSRARDALGGFTLGTAGAVFALVGTVYGWSTFLHYLTKTGVSTTGFSTPISPSFVLGDLPMEAWTILLFVGPLLVLPAFGREERWGTLPYFAAVLFGGQMVFWYPFKNQYPVLIVPFLFVATLRGIERLREPATPDGTPRSAAPPLERSRRTRPFSLARPGSVSGLVLLTVFAVGLVVAPWGPFNPQLAGNPFLSRGYYNIGSSGEGNATVNAEIRQLALSVPASAVLLTQINLPESLDRPFFTFPGRFTPNIPITMLLTDPYSGDFYSPTLGGGPLPTPMIDWANYYLARGWGTWGEAGGALLLAANYSGPMHVYFPEQEWFAPGNFGCCGDTTVWSGPEKGLWLNGPSLPWTGSLRVLSPGHFVASLEFAIDHPNATDRIDVRLGANQTPLVNATIWGSGWTGTSGTIGVPIPFNVSSYLVNPHFSVRVERWTGALDFVGLEIDEVAPPP